MLTGLLAPTVSRFVANKFEQRATQELGKQLAKGIGDISENIVSDTVSSGVSDFVEGATGIKPKIVTGGPTLGGLGSMGYSMLWGQYNRSVADDVTGGGIPQQSTLYTMGATARQVSGFDRIRAMTTNNTNKS